MTLRRNLKKSFIVLLAIFAVCICPISTSAEEADYSKFSGEIYQTYLTMDDDERATVLLYLAHNNEFAGDLSDTDKAAMYAEREADNKMFLKRYTSIKEEDVLFVGKYQRQVAVNATKAELTRFWCDSDVLSITDFEMDLGLSNGMTGADVKYALEEYLANENYIDEVSVYLKNVGESNGIPLVQYKILPSMDETTVLRIQNYLFVAHGRSVVSDLGFFAIVDDKLVPFEDCVNNAIVNVDDGAGAYDSAYKIENLGDMNNDGKLNIKDATYLQKGLAGLVEMPKITFDFEDFINYDVTDFNGDGAVNIKDATAIQKYIAKL